MRVDYTSQRDNQQSRANAHTDKHIHAIIPLVSGRDGLTHDRAYVGVKICAQL